MTKKTQNKKKANKANGERRLILWFWRLFGTGVLLILLLFLLASWGVFGSLPDETSLENPEKDLATQIISSDGKVIGKFFKENRTPVQYEDLPEQLVNGGAETGDLTGWSATGPQVAAVTEQEQSTGTVYPHEGSYFFTYAQVPGQAAECVFQVWRYPVAALQKVDRTAAESLRGQSGTVQKGP